MNIADARDAYLNWNQKAHQDLIERSNTNQQQAIKLIPLLFQINHRLLPGYNGPDTPAGIYGYTIDKTVLNAAGQLNKQFHYEQESVLRRCIIQSVFLQESLTDDGFLLWVIHSENIKTRQLNELQDKLDRIVRWLQGRGLKVTAYLSVEKDLVKKIKRHRKSFFSSYFLLNSFYGESILLAGKYPVWWLVPEDEEAKYRRFIEHAVQVKLINEDDFIDFGCERIVDQDDCLKQLMTYMKSVVDSAEKSYLELFMFLLWVDNSSEHKIPALHIKQQLHKGVRYYASLLLYPVVLDQLQAFYDQMPENEKRQLQRLWAYLAESVSASSRFFKDLAGGLEYQHQDDVFEKVKLFKLLQQQIKSLSEAIFRICHSDNEALNTQIENMLVLLSEKNNKIQVYSRGRKIVDAFDRVLLRQEINHQWSLVLSGEEGEEKTLPGFENPLALLSWLWLNRLVNGVTQVSIDSPSHEVLQVEAYQLLGILIQKLNPEKIFDVSARAYENDARPLQILVFVNARTNSCEQLMVNSWGDVYCSEYKNNGGLIDCICEWTWHIPEKGRVKLPEFSAFGYSAGDANYLAQRMEQVFHGVFEYFYEDKLEGQFIVNMNEDYYRIKNKDKQLFSDAIGRHEDVLNYLESENRRFVAYGLERYTLTDSPLREIFKQNKEHLVQLFFRLAGRNVEAWVVDEKGSVWFCRQLCLDRDAYITQWLYFFHHVFSRLKKIKYQDTPCPSVEIQQISINQMGNWDFFPVSSESMAIDADFFNVQVLIESVNHQDQMSLVCDGHHFDFQQSGQDALSRCIQYIRQHSRPQSHKPVYITDMDIPLRLYKVAERDDIQTLHYLKYKRRFEKKLNQLVSQPLQSV